MTVKEVSYYEKIIALMLSVLIPVGMSIPVFAAQNEEGPVKTVAEILNDYHAESFEKQITQKSETVRAYARSSGSAEKTLEEETVEELTAAGYEAYNVTSSNYEELEASLKTDFEDLGLDPNESYIIVISGEEAEGTSYAVHYSDYDWRKEQAARAYLNDTLSTDYVGNIKVFLGLNQSFPVDTTVPIWTFYCPY